MRFHQSFNTIFNGLVLLSSITILLGCDSTASKYVPVSGKLAVNGQPYDPQTQEEVMLILYPTDSNAGTTFPAIVDSDGSFRVPGVDGKGVLPGKYKISLERMADDRKKLVQVPKALVGPDSKLERDIAVGAGDLGTIDVMQVPQ